MLVPDYAVGFGPALWKKKIGDTTYALRAILLGGYVKIVGMYAPARPGTRLVGRGGKPTLAQEAREASTEEIPEGQEHRAFYRLSAPKKIAVMLGGPLMNLLICIVLSAVTMIGIGAPTASRTIADVPATITSASGEVASPAYEAGVRPGDTVLAWNGQPVATFAQLQRAIGATPEGESAVLTVERDGTTVDLTVSPVTGSHRWCDRGVRVRVCVACRCGSGQLAEVHRDDGGCDPAAPGSVAGWSLRVHRREA